MHPAGASIKHILDLEAMLDIDGLLLRDAFSTRTARTMLIARDCAAVEERLVFWRPPHYRTKLVQAQR
jgi:hypothetical protein